MNVHELQLDPTQVMAAQQWAVHLAIHKKRDALCFFVEAVSRGDGNTYVLDNGRGQEVFNRNQLKLIAALLAKDGWQLILPPGKVNATFTRVPV